MSCLLVAGESQESLRLPSWPQPLPKLPANSTEQGTEDVVFGQTVPVEQIKLFTTSKEAKFTLVQGGAHYLNATSPTEVGDALLELVSKYK